MLERVLPPQVAPAGTGLLHKNPVGFVNNWSKYFKKPLSQDTARDPSAQSLRGTYKGLWSYSFTLAR